jgi:glycerol-3-phosphate dehydrogenase (NAD(P)+)
VRLVGTHLDGEIVASCRQRHYHPRLRRALPPGVLAYDVGEVGLAFRGAEVVVSGVNSFGVRWLGQTIGPHLRPGQAIIAVTKGLEAGPGGELRILPDVLAEELPAGIRDRVGLAAIGGPCIAGELAARRPSCVLYGSRDRYLAERLAALFRTGYYHAGTTGDLLSLEVSVALKNAYALSVGMAAGLLGRAGGPDEAGAGMHNLAAACFAQACTEMAALLRAVGGDPAYACGLPGVGDLYVTCQGGRSWRLGRLLGLGRSCDEARSALAGETLEAAACVQVMGQVLPVLEACGAIGPADLPLMRALVGVVVHGHPVELPLERFAHAPEPGG